MAPSSALLLGVERREETTHHQHPLKHHEHEVSWSPNARMTGCCKVKRKDCGGGVGIGDIECKLEGMKGMARAKRLPAIVTTTV